MPQDLADCLIFGRNSARCEYIQFDSDGSTVSGLQVFDHGAPVQS